jgi:hypothetical protein
MIMGDYLSNLVARSFALGEVVQLRPISLFEPTPVPDLPVFEEPGALEIDEEPVPESPNYETPLPAHDPPEQHSLSPRSIINEENESLETLNSPLPTPTQMEEQVFPRDLPTSQSAPISAPRSSSMAKPPRDRSMAQPLRSLLVMPTEDIDPSFEPVIRQGGGEHDAISSGTTETIRGETNEDPVSPPKERKSRPGLKPILPHTVVSSIRAPFTDLEDGHPVAVTPPLAVEREERSFPQPTASRPGDLIPLASTPFVIQPLVKPYEEPPSQDLARPAEMPNAMPTIHVTIGRVEVRATPPPSPLKKEQPNRTPVMSLDEYLHQRAQESRR